jgi:DNA-directed RNA polymerase subunit beta'
MSQRESQPFGRILVNQYLPEKYRVSGAITKKSLQKSMNEMAHKDPHGYANSVVQLKRVGDELATLEGLTIGLDDITPDYAERRKILAPLQRKFRAAKTDDQRRDIAEQAQGAFLKETEKHTGSLAQQVHSGARGSPSDYSNIVSGVGYGRDTHGRVEPWLIDRSYAEGMRPADYWVTTGQSMMDTIKTYTEVSVPGELAKKLVANMSDIVVTEDDCGTHNGILMDPTSPDVVDRFLARDAGPFRRNMLVTPIVQPKLAKLKGQILVRSPMTCEAGDGVCQKCQGLDEKGNIQQVGTNVGIRAAQAMSEPLTQFALNAKHGRTLKADKTQVHGVQGFRQIIESPQQFINKATLSELDGKVTKIEKAPQGGNFVYVDSQQHYVTPIMGVTVNVGQHVERGDSLSEGIPKPDELVRHKGIGVGRLYMMNSLKNIYANQGQNLDQRHFELLARGGLNHVRILNDPSKTFIKGDIVSYTNLKSSLGQSTKTVALKDSLGDTLGKEYFQFAAGMRVTPPMIEFLKQQKVKEVVISPRAPEVEFVMKSATMAPRMHADWLARMAHQGLKTTMQQAAQTGEKSNLHGTHPVPAYTYGVEFGQGEKGRY